MKRKLLFVFIMLLFVVGVSGCKKDKKEEEKKENKPEESEKTNALLFKQEYEGLNDKENAKGIKHRSVTISEDNPFIYQTADEIVERINNGETFYVYFGDTQCPWCRSCIEVAVSMAKEYNIEKIYYVKIWDDDHNEILRDKLSVNENGEVVTDKEGTESYYKLLDLLDSVLSDYTLNGVEPTEKRIYAPNYIYIENGTPIILVEGTSELQKDSREELTEEMLKDEKEAFKKLFDR